MEWSDFDINNSLHDIISSKFEHPTEIQQKVLKYISAKVDLIIQARTGEGKTLCYLLPITNYIINFYTRNEELYKKISPVAIILVPTRELGVQVRNHLKQILTIKQEGKDQILFNIKIAEVLGGFAKPKQLKVLNKYSPEIIIATPGRLWEIISNEESQILEKLNHLKFLVIDEADRMNETGHFSELKNIISHIYSKIEIEMPTQNVKDVEEEEEDKNVIEEQSESLNSKLEEDLKENEEIAKQLNVNVKDIETIDPILLMDKDAEIENIDDEEENIENEEENEEEGNQNKKEIEDDSNEEESENYNNKEQNDNDKKMVNLKSIKKSKNKENIEKNIVYKNKVNLRTILCSATIEQLHQNSKTKKNKGSFKANSLSNTDQESNFEKVIKNLKFYNKLIYLKLNTAPSLIPSLTQTNSISLKETETICNILPSKLEVDCYKCDPTTKDYYLYFLLKENPNSKIIIFTNSISHTKKLYSIFSYFTEFNCTILHSKLLQSSRIKNLEKFAQKKNPILFCTDIGARGLDIPFVDLVIHYHIPKKVETFIHRSGRTARANQNGRVSSLVTQNEFSLYKKILCDLKLKNFSLKSLSLSHLEEIKSLFEYAKKIEKENFVLKKKSKEKQWFKKNAEECDIEYSDEERLSDIDEEVKAREKFLNKKRKLFSKEKLKQKKIYTKLNESHIKRSSFLSPDDVNKLNNILKDDMIKNQNLTNALYQASLDSRRINFKEKTRKKRYMRRRKGK